MKPDKPTIKDKVLAPVRSVVQFVRFLRFLKRGY